MVIKNMVRVKNKVNQGTEKEQTKLKVFKLEPAAFTKKINELFQAGYRLAFLLGTDDRIKDKTFGVRAFLTLNGEAGWTQVLTALPEDKPTYPSLTSTIMAAIWYEKYLMDMFGVVAEDHPDPRRLVHHENVPLGTYPLRKDFAWNMVLDKANVPFPMVQVAGNGIYEIPVGPIHAGIIEPGHFRFNVAGEKIVNLEGKLFFTHKGVEKLLEGKTVEQALPMVERISDDSAASHALAFVLAVEMMAKEKVSDRANYLRTLMVELERITMHIHDLANIAGMGTGYSVMAAHGFRIKEKMVRLSEDILGNRFWRGFIIPGGVARDLSLSELDKLFSGLQDVMEEMRSLLKIGLESDGLLERMVSSGILRLEVAKAYGAVGIAARATDQKMDTRKDHPYAAYDKLKFSVVTKSGGDVLARYMVRVEELENSFQLVEQLMELLRKTSGEIKINLNLVAGEALSAVEGWRGEILHFVRLNDKGFIDRMAVRDPSFCNWPLFGEIGPGNIVPDFPLCNKSLNLSYSGNDL